MAAAFVAAGGAAPGSASPSSSFLAAPPSRHPPPAPLFTEEQPRAAAGPQGASAGAVLAAGAAVGLALAAAAAPQRRSRPAATRTAKVVRHESLGSDKAVDEAVVLEAARLGSATHVHVPPPPPVPSQVHVPPPPPVPAQVHVPPPPAMPAHHVIDLEAAGANPPPAEPRRSPEAAPVAEREAPAAAAAAASTAAPATAAPASVSLGTRVLWGGRYEGTVRFVGPTHFAPGNWVGVELDSEVGKHDGTFDDVSYFACPDQRGVLCQLPQLAVIPPKPGAAHAKSTKDANAQIAAAAPSPVAPPEPAPKAAAPPAPLAVGQRVVWSGEYEGTVRYIGQTHFSAGDWVGVELDNQYGKHDGTFMGISYFKCPPQHGIFTSAFLLRPAPNQAARPAQAQATATSAKGAAAVAAAAAAAARRQAEPPRLATAPAKPVRAPEPLKAGPTPVLRVKPSSSLPSAPRPAPAPAPAPPQPAKMPEFAKVVAISALLCFASGMVNAIAVIVLGGPISHQTGNTTHMGRLWGTDGLRFAMLVAAFMVGAGVVGYRKADGNALFEGRPCPIMMSSALGIVAGAMLYLACGNARLVTMPMWAFTQGMQNAVTSRFGLLALRTTHHTGNLTDMGAGLGMLLRAWRKGEPVPSMEKPILFFFCILAYAVGGYGAKFATDRWGIFSSLPPAAILGVLAWGWLPLARFVRTKYLFGWNPFYSRAAVDRKLLEQAASLPAAQKPNTIRVK